MALVTTLEDNAAVAAKLSSFSLPKKVRSAKAIIKASLADQCLIGFTRSLSRFLSMVAF